MTKLNIEVVEKQLCRPENVNNEYVLHNGKLPIHIIIDKECKMRRVSNYYKGPLDLNQLKSMQFDILYPIKDDTVDFTYELINELQLKENFSVDLLIKLATEFKQHLNKKDIVYFGTGALKPEHYNKIEYILYGAINGVTIENYASPFRRPVGLSVLCQDGHRRMVVGRNMSGYKGYETIFLQDENYPYNFINVYDRSTSDSDFGRVTGSCHQYTDPRNILFKKYGNRYKLFQDACKQLEIIPNKSELFSQIHPVPALDKKIIDLMGGCWSKRKEKLHG